MYPSQKDTFPLSPLEPVGLLGSVYGALEDVEAHVGAAVLSGGDTTVSGSTTLPGPGRKVCLLTATYVVPAGMDNSSGLYIRWDSLFDPAAVGRSHPLAAPESIHGDSLSLTQDPLFISAYRPYTNTSPSVTIVSGSPSLVSLSLKDTDVKLRGGETINLSFLMYAGTL